MRIRNDTKTKFFHTESSKINAMIQHEKSIESGDTQPHWRWEFFAERTTKPYLTHRRVFETRHEAERYAREYLLSKTKKEKREKKLVKV
jgi:hypothetical protein